MSALAVVAACNSPKDALDPSSIKPTEQSNALASAEGTDAGAPTLAPAPAAPAPLSPQTAAIVTERLGVRARARGITLAGSTDTSPPGIIMRGYFSAMTEGANTTVVYVWDVYDPAGTRLHRINGQQSAASTGAGDGWPTVAPTTMQAIADSTIDQLVDWLAARAG